MKKRKRLDDQSRRELQIEVGRLQQENDDLRRQMIIKLPPPIITPARSGKGDKTVKIKSAETVAVIFAILGAGLIGASLPARVPVDFQPIMLGAGLACVAIAAVVMLWLVAQGWRDPDNWIP